MTILDSRTSRVLLTILLFALGLGFLYAARRTLILFLFAIFFAYLINPAVLRLDKFARGRTRAIAVIYFCSFWQSLWFFVVRRAPELAAKVPVLRKRFPA